VIIRLSTAASVLLLATACVVGSDTDIETQAPELVATGADLNAANCAECHGEDLQGTDKGPSHLSILYEPGHHADGAFMLAVTQGVQPHHWNFGAMPRIEGLPTEDLEAIVAFVREQQRLEGFEPYPPS
jgi:mono/diheme cytochrome c family protein